MLVIRLTSSLGTKNPAAGVLFEPRYRKWGLYFRMEDNRKPIDAGYDESKFQLGSVVDSDVETKSSCHMHPDNPVSKPSVWPGFYFLLGVLAVATMIGFFRNQATSGLLEITGLVRGWDFQQFYLAGMMPPEKLYDISAFQNQQRALFPIDEQNIPFLPLYPPMLSLYVSPLSSLPYPPALGIWWALSVLSYGLSCYLMWRSVDARWRRAVMLVMLGFFPFFVSMRLGQFAPILMLILVSGLYFRSGFILSLLAVKPQFAVGLLIYWILRREWRLAVELIVGGLLQVGLVVCTMGHEVIFDYLHFTQVYLYHAELFSFPGGWVHTLAGMTGKTVQFLVVVLVALSIAFEPKQDWQKECAWAVSFMLLFTPHLLLYDLVFLLIPMVWLLPNWRLPVALLVISSALTIKVWAILGISVVPFILIAILLGNRLERLPEMLKTRLASKPVWNPSIPNAT